MITKTIVCLVVSTVLFNIAAAQSPSVPPLINYQGRLTDAAGTAINGTRNLAFKIYTNAVTGTNVWGPQVFNGVSVINGSFNVILGSTDQSGRSILDAFGGTNRYLGISVDAGAEITPRQQILSAPYAVQADRAKHGVPAGTILAFGGTNVPDGWLLCDGSAVSRTQRASLFAAIGTVWGVGDGSTTFNLPDLRGMYLRGAGTHATRTNAVGGYFAGGAVGAYQQDQFQGHWHQLTANIREPAGGNSTYRTADDSWTAYDQSYYRVQDPKNGNNGPVRWGNETKPASYSVNHIIKY